MTAYVEKFGRSRVQSMLPHMTVRLDPSLDANMSHFVNGPVN